MKRISLQELFDCIEEHAKDTLSYLIKITEGNNQCFHVNFLNDGKVLELSSIINALERYDWIYQAINEQFKGRTHTIKVHTVSSGEYIYLIIAHNVCITFQYMSELGQKWLQVFCND